MQQSTRSPVDQHTDNSQLVVRVLGRQQYEGVWRNMQQFTNERGPDTRDELWLVEHPPIFTQGLNGKPEHLLQAGDIPVIQVDRGGQVTYHGPGQVVAYLLMDLQRHKLGIRQLVTLLEQAAIDLLAEYDIEAEARRDAPGVYVDGRKIAALGLRVRRGCCYHGLSLNVDMDLSPFSCINPCGYRGMEVTQMKDLGVTETPAQIRHKLSGHLARILGYTMQQVNND